jgi:hypothetical protein
MKWSEKDFNILLVYYPIGGYKLVNTHLDVKRTRISIVRKAIHSNVCMDETNKHVLFSEQGKKTCKKIRGEDNPNWKNGISKDNYHYKKLQMQRYPEHVKARELVNRALKSGKISKMPCAVCGNNNVVAHHPDYSKPLNVIWLCRKHHRELHDGKINLSCAAVR